MPAYGDNILHLTVRLLGFFRQLLSEYVDRERGRWFL